MDRASPGYLPGEASWARRSGQAPCRMAMGAACRGGAGSTDEARSSNPYAHRWQEGLIRSPLVRPGR